MPGRMTLFQSGSLFLGLCLAAGLALFWALRGAAPGRKVAENAGADVPSPGTRDRAALLAVLAMILVAGGAFVAAMVSIPWSVPLFAVGFGLNLAVANANRRYRHESAAMRRIVRFLDAALTGSLLAGILVVGNVLAFRYGERPIDLTRERVFSLESLTVNQLRSLKRPVRFVAFFGNNSRAIRQLDRVEQLLKLYRAENPAMVKYEVIPFADPTRFEELVRRFPAAAVSPGGVAVEYGEGASADRLVVRNAEMFEAAPSADPSRIETVFRGEDALTSALIRLREVKKTRVAFLTGHGESPTVATTPNRPSLGLFKTRLEGQGCEVAEIDLTREAIPPAVAVALLAAPQTAFGREDLERLTSYATRGGRLLILLDATQKTGLDDWLKDWGVAVGPGLVVDPRAPFMNNPAMVPFRVSPRDQHPVVAPLINRMVLLPNASPLTAPGVKALGTRADVILSAPAEDWAETDLATRPPVLDPAKDRPGPHGVAVAVAVADPSQPRGAEPSPRMVVFGSPRLADDFLVSDPHLDTNLDLVVNAVNWLRGRPDLEGIAPRRRDVPEFSADPGLQARLVAIPSVLALAAIVGLGVMTYLARRA